MSVYAYIGCRTTKERSARGKGISVYSAEKGRWELLQILEGEVNPSYLCLNEAQNRLYAIHGDFCQVSSYEIHEDGTISPMNTVDTHGTNPVHLTLDPTGKWLFVANLQTGGVSVIPVKEDGSLGHIKELKFISGNGGPGYISHPHQVKLDGSGRWLLVPSQGRLQGIGKITVFEVDSKEGDLREHFVVKARTGAEPRHCVFHPNNRFCYVLNEKDSTAALYYFDEGKGTLEGKQILMTIPEDYTGDGWASAIDIDPEGRFLYVSNRKHDSVTVFTLDQENGHMSWLQNIATEGVQPRFITVSPDGSQLLAANELSDTIRIFDVEEDGHLAYSGVTVATESPVCAVYKTK